MKSIYSVSEAHSPLRRVHGLPPLGHKRLPDLLLARRLQSPAQLALRRVHLRSCRPTVRKLPQAQAQRTKRHTAPDRRTSADLRNESAPSSCMHLLICERSSVLQRSSKSVTTRTRECLRDSGQTRAKLSRALWGTAPGRLRRLPVPLLAAATHAGGVQGARRSARRDA